FAMLGGYQDRLSPSYAEPGGAWRWITGEPFEFTAWFSIEPNNGNGAGEDYLAFREFDCNARWNDTGNNPSPNHTYIIEWSADCNNDGIVDFGQIRAGELDDANGNNIPDCCEQGTPCACPADIDANGSVNGIDLAIILNKWGTDGGKDYPNADQNKDGTVNAADLAAVLNGWGPCS
ncbi:MAG: dockerin type I domain-containing protein, partial [Phycisphaerales bacterium]